MHESSISTYFKFIFQLYKCQICIMLTTLTLITCMCIVHASVLAFTKTYKCKHPCNVQCPIPDRIHVNIYSMLIISASSPFTCGHSRLDSMTSTMHVFFLHHITSHENENFHHNRFLRPLEKQGKKLQKFLPNRCVFFFSARPGRPPKRSSLASLPDAMEKLKKSRLDAADYAYSPARLMGRCSRPASLFCNFPS